MTSLYLHHAFIDEAGSVALSSHSHFLIVAALCTDDPRAIDRLIRKVQKKYGSPLSSGELKAKQASDKLTITLLDALAQEEVGVFAMVVDHRQLDPSDQAGHDAGAVDREGEVGVVIRPDRFHHDHCQS